MSDIDATDHVIVIGGGHNGLVAAAYLARAGRRVTVLDARPVLGGLMAPRPFFSDASGTWTAPGLHHDTGGFRPFVAKDLGLKLTRHAPAPLLAPRPDGRVLRLAGDTLSGADNPTEQDAFARWQAFIVATRPVIARIMDSAPLSVNGSLWQLLKTGWAVRSLGPETMMELARVAPMCVADWMRDSFSDERLMAALSLGGVEGVFTGPWSAHTAATLLIRRALDSGPVAGGGPAIIAALAGACRAAGVTLRTDARVKRIEIDPATGHVRGVALEVGESLAATTIIATGCPKQTLLSLVGHTALPTTVSAAARSYRTRGITAKVHLALGGPLKLATGETVEHLRICQSLDDVERAFDAGKYGEDAPAPALDVRVPSVSDPSLCPAGGAVVTITAHGFGRLIRGVPSPLEDIAQRTIAALARWCPALAEPSELLLGHEALGPAELSTEFGLSGGHLWHGEPSPDQQLFMRPTIDCGQYRTPVGGLFLGGGGSHPGGGVSGAPGALAAQAALEK